MKRQPTEWEKIFVNNMMDKGLIFRIYKERIQLNIKKPNNSIKKKTGSGGQKNTKQFNFFKKGEKN